MSIQRSRSYFAEFWPSTAQLKERYNIARKSIDLTSKTTSKAKDDAHFDELVILFHGQLLEFYITKQRTLDSSFKLKLHELYKYLCKDYSRVFKLLDNGTISLLAHLDFDSLPINATPDHIGIFECLLLETISRYDGLTGDCDDDYNHVYYVKIIKPICILLINYLKYTRLPTAKIELVAGFVCKLSQYSLTMTSLLDYWFDVAICEPDVVYLLHRYKLPLNCFPIYELIKDFLFMGDLLFMIAKETLLHLVLATGFNKSLEDWLLQSDFPGLVITGLLSNFNQICYNEIILSNYEDGFDEILINNENFKEYKLYLTFIIDIISYSTHDSVKIVFLNGLHSRFINPVIEYYSVNESYRVNIIFLLSKTVDQLISVHGVQNCTTTMFIAEELIERSFKNSPKTKRYSLLDIFQDSVLQPGDNPIMIISSLNLFSSFCRSRQINLVSELFCNDNDLLKGSPSNPIITNSLNDLKLTLLMKKLLKSDELYKDILFDKLDESYSLLRKNEIHDLNNLTPSKTWLQFDSQRDVPSIMLSYLLFFFTNGNDINRSLISLVRNLATFHGGKIFNFILNDSGNLEQESTLFWTIFTHLYESFEAYTGELNSGTKLVEVITPSSKTKQCFDNCSLRIRSFILETSKSPTHTSPLSFDKLALNLELFKDFTIELSAIHKVRNIFNCVQRK